MGDILATIDVDQKVGAAVPLSVGELDPHLAQFRLGRGLYFRTKWYPDLIHPAVRPQ